MRTTIATHKTTSARTTICCLPLLLVLLAVTVPVQVQAQENDIVDFSEGGCQEDCSQPGHFCGTDGACRPFSCQNFYQYADPKLTGYDASTPLQCLGYNQGNQDNQHGVLYGCEPLFPGVTVQPGKQVTYAFNERCVAEREGFSYTCYQFQEDAVATSFTTFLQTALSSFPDCGDGNPQATFFAPITASAHYLGTEGLQGNPIVSSGSDIDGDTMWQQNSMQTFEEEVAMYAMYADVVGGPEPGGASEGGSLNLGDADPGPNPLDQQSNIGDEGDDSAAFAALVVVEKDKIATLMVAVVAALAAAVL